MIQREKNRAGTQKVDVTTYYSFNECPSELAKKVDLFNHFAKYLSNNDSAKQTKLQPADPDRRYKIGTVFIKKWTKTAHGIIFCLNNQLVQVYYKDHTELFVNMHLKLVTFINKEAQVTTIPNSDVQKSTDVELKKRLQYTRDLLSNKSQQSGGGQKQERQQSTAKEETSPDALLEAPKKR